MSKHQPSLKSDVSENPFPCYDCQNKSETSFNENSDYRFSHSYSSPEDYAAHLLGDVHRAEAKHPLKPMNRRRSTNNTPKTNDVRTGWIFMNILPIDFLIYIHT